VHREAAGGIHRGATGKRVVVADFGELRQREAQGSLQTLQLAGLPRSDDLLNTQSQRMAAVMECLQHNPI
jgi:hypothetical protein